MILVGSSDGTHVQCSPSDSGAGEPEHEAVEEQGEEEEREEELDDKQEREQ